MDYSIVLCLVLIVGLLACMTADFILDVQSIWDSYAVAISSSLDDDHRGSGRDEKPPTKLVADLSWVNLVEDSEPLPEMDVIQLAKSRMKVKPVISAGIKVRQLLDNLGKQVQSAINYSNMNIRQLKAIAKERGLAKYGSMRKAELVAALSS